MSTDIKDFDLRNWFWYYSISIVTEMHHSVRLTLCPATRTLWLHLAPLYDALPAVQVPTWCRRCLLKHVWTYFTCSAVILVSYCLRLFHHCLFISYGSDQSINVDGQFKHQLHQHNIAFSSVLECCLLNVFEIDVPYFEYSLGEAAEIWLEQVQHHHYFLNLISQIIVLWQPIDYFLPPISVLEAFTLSLHLHICLFEGLSQQKWDECWQDEQKESSARLHRHSFKFIVVTVDHIQVGILLSQSLLDHDPSQIVEYAVRKEFEPLDMTIGKSIR